MTTNDPTDEEFRLAGFTPTARDYPRDELSVKLLAAFNGIDPARMPIGWKYFPNPTTKAAWERVAKVVEEHFKELTDQTVKEK